MKRLGFVLFLIAVCALPGTGCSSSTDAGDSTGFQDQSPGDGRSTPDVNDTSAPPDVRDNDLTTDETEPGDADGSERPDPCQEIPSPCGLVQYANPLVGSGELGWRLGNSFVGVQMPFGMIRMGPDTSDTTDGKFPLTHCVGYFHPDNSIDGFVLSHLHGIGVPDGGDILFMPVNEMTEATTTTNGYRQQFSHKKEVARPDYYEVTFTDSKITTQLTSTLRSGIQRYTFQPSTTSTVIVDVSYVLPDCTADNVAVHIDKDNNAVYGRKRNHGALSGRHGGYDVYFYAQFSRPFVSFGTFESGKLYAGQTDREAVPAGAYFVFDTTGDPVVEVRTAISFVDDEGAKKNFDAEIRDKTFGDVYWSAYESWQKELAMVEAEFYTEEDRKVFYTSLYHSVLMPTLYNDVDGRYTGFDKAVHTVGWDGSYYTDLSLWDTYRTTHPLFVYMWPQQQLDVVRSLVAMKEQGGYLPKWPQGSGYTNCMVGTSADIVIADTYLKGLTDFPVDSAFDGMLDTATSATAPGSPYGGRGDVAAYLEHGYEASDKSSGSVSKTLEYTYDDYCIARMARAMGETETANEFDARALFYKNIYDHDRGFMIGRKSDGSFEESFNPIFWEDYYTEGNAWQYVWFVPHDPKGLAELMGGWDVFLSRLDEFFVNTEQTWNTLVPGSYYYHGNEPDIHAAFQYSLAGRPDDTSRWVRWIDEYNYFDAPEGIPGNDDAGTLGAWYVFAALGFYPVPCADQYALLNPLVKSAKVMRGNGKSVLEITKSGEGELIDSIRLDGQTMDRAWLTHEQLDSATGLEFGLGSESREWLRVGD